MLIAHWSLVFTAWDVDDSAMELYLAYVVEVPADFDWPIGVATVAGAIERTSDSTPGPDGVPYAAWRSQASAVAPVIHVALIGVTDGKFGLPPETN